MTRRIGEPPTPGERWWAGCQCGWKGPVVADRRTARQALIEHPGHFGPSDGEAA